MFTESEAEIFGTRSKVNTKPFSITNLICVASHACERLRSAPLQGFEKLAMEDLSAKFEALKVSEKKLAALSPEQLKDLQKVRPLAVLYRPYFPVRRSSGILQRLIFLLVFG